MDAIKNIKDYAELFSLCKWMKAFFLLNTQDSGYHQTWRMKNCGCISSSGQWRSRLLADKPSSWAGSSFPVPFPFCTTQARGRRELENVNQLPANLAELFPSAKDSKASSQLFHSSAVFLTAPVYLGIILQQFWPELAWPERYLPP